MDRRLLEDGGEDATFSVQHIVTTTHVSRRPVLSGSSVEMLVWATALLHIGVGLICLMGNIMLLFLLVSYPLHEFQLLQVTILKEDPSHNVFHLANFSKKQVVFLFTLSALYFMLEIMVANFLLVGIKKRSKARCQLWVDVHRLVVLVHTACLLYNMCDFQDKTASTLTFILLPVVVCMLLSICLVRKFIRDIANQDFTSAVFHIQK